MIKKIIWVIVIILVLGAGAAFYFITDNPNENKQSNTSQNSSEKTDAGLSGSTGSYAVYSEDTFKNTRGQRILFFYAPLCSQCRDLEASIKNGEIPEGVTIFEIDYDSNQALRQKYGVTLQTTLVKVDDQGNEIDKFVAYDEPTLDALIKNLL